MRVWLSVVSPQQHNVLNTSRSCPSASQPDIVREHSIPISDHHTPWHCHFCLPTAAVAASATMSDLPNELILDISRRIPKASERLHLTLANHRMSRLIGSILYEHIIISKAAYGLKCRKLGDNPSFATYAAIRSLARTLRRNKHHFGSAIHTLEISLEHRYPLETHIQHKQNIKSFGLTLLTPQFNTLQHLHLAMTGHMKYTCRRSERFSPCALLPPLL